MKTAQEAIDVYYKEHLFHEKRCIFDPFFREHAQKEGPRYDQMRAFNALEFACLSLAFQKKRGGYREGAISKGMEANLWALKEGPFKVVGPDGNPREIFETNDLDEKIGHQNYYGEVILKNLAIQKEGLALFKKVLPETSILVPVFLESAVRLAGQALVDRGVKRRDKDFMVMWDPAIIEFIDCFLMQGDWHFSRMSNLEVARAVLIAAGLERERRPDADMNFIDGKGDYFTLYQIIRKRSEYVLWAAEKGFTLDVEPTTLMRDFAIARMVHEGKLPHANHRFASAVHQEYAKIEELYNAMVPLILEKHAAGFFDVDTEDMAETLPEFVKAYQAGKKSLRAEEALSYDELHRRFDLPYYGMMDLSTERYNHKELLEIHRAREVRLGDDLLKEGVQRPPHRSLDLSGKSLENLDGQSLFSYPFLEIMNEREKLQAYMILGASQAVYPGGDRSFFIIGDEKYGPETDKLVKADKIAYGDEAPNYWGRSFPEKIKEPHRENLLRIKEKFSEYGHVISSSDLDTLFDYCGAHPELLVAPGEARPSPRAVMAIRHLLMSRNSSEFVFATGHWEQSNKGVQDAVLAARMAYGLQAGATYTPEHVRLWDEHGRPHTLYSLAAAIWKPLSRVVSKREPFELVEPATALAQLWALHKLSQNPLQRLMLLQKVRDEGRFVPEEDIPWESLSLTLKSYDPKAFDRLWEKEMAPVLLTGDMASALRLRDLDKIDAFAETARKQQRLNQLAVSNESPDVFLLTRKGGSKKAIQKFSL